MAITRPNRTQHYAVKDTSNLSTSVQASRASARMYDELTNSALKLGDVATSSAINSEIRNAQAQGHMIGVDATRQDDDGAFKGYENKSEIFKWDVASNQASEQAFNANVSNRASTSMAQLANDVNGNKRTYENVAKKLASDAVVGVEDEAQRQQITNSYAKAYNQNMNTVSKKYFQIESKMAKDGWESGRVTFKDDYSIALSAIIRDEAKLSEAQKDGDTDAMMAIMDTLDLSKAELSKFKDSRMASASSAIQMGVISEDSAKVETHLDIVTAMKTSIVRAYDEADTTEGKLAIRDSVANMPEADGTSDEVMAMTPTAKKQILDALDMQELHEQKMWNSDKSRSDKEYTIAKGEAVSDIQTSILLDGENAIQNIDDAFGAGYISLSQRNGYLDHVVGGEPVVSDNWNVYTDIVGNIEDYTIEDISAIENLTDATKRKFISDRATWDEEGEKWMSAPDYREGKQLIKEQYGFQDASVLPEFLTGKKKEGYVEMQNLIQEYRDEKRQSVAKDGRNDGVAIAEKLLKAKKEDITSKLRPAYVHSKMITSKDLIEESAVTGKNLVDIMTEQMDKFPDSTLSDDATEKLSAPEQTTIEDGGWFGKDKEVLSKDWVEYQMNITGQSDSEVRENYAKDKFARQKASFLKRVEEENAIRNMKF